MRALVYRETGLVLDTNYPQPKPMNGEALIRVLLAGICNTDLEILRGDLGFHGVAGPEVLGVVEALDGGGAQEEDGDPMGERVVGGIKAAVHPPACPSGP